MLAWNLPILEFVANITSNSTAVGSAKKGSTKGVFSKIDLESLQKLDNHKFCPEECTIQLNETASSYDNRSELMKRIESPRTSYYDSSLEGLKIFGLLGLVCIFCFGFCLFIPISCFYGCYSWIASRLDTYLRNHYRSDQSQREEIEMKEIAVAGPSHEVPMRAVLTRPTGKVRVLVRETTSEDE
jgi:hypothetical protein